MTTLLVPRHAVPARRLNPFSLFSAALPAAQRPAADVAPRIDVHETDEAWRIDAELPGLDREDIKVDVEEGVLTIAAERKHESEENDEAKGYRHLERYHGSFRRSLRLPEDVAGENLTASYKNGVLAITIPKPPEVKPEVLSIPVEVA